MEYLSIDFESRSTVLLPKTGVYPYAEDETTDIICMAWAIGDMEPEVWLPRPDSRNGSTAPTDPLVKHIKAGKPLRAHNANFERILWREILGPRYGFPIPDLDQWFCTAAEAAAMSLPRSLKKVARVLNVDEQKDDDGRKLMLRLCKPRAVEDDGTIRWWDEEDLEKRERLIEYCKQDVRTERAVAKKLRRLGSTERKVYLLDQKINDRGVRLDVPLIRAARDIVDEEMSRANQELAEITNGEVTKATQVQRLNRWVNDNGAELDNLQKSTIRDVLDEGDVEGDVRRALEIRQDAGKTSLGKIPKMLECLCEDDYARGLLLYHGAGTGRWSGKLIQPQNFPRPTIKDVEQYIPYVMDGSLRLHHDNPLEVISSMLRSMLIASPGHRLMAEDLAQIEARVTGWFANEPYGDMEYEKMAASIFNVPLDEVGPDSEERQVGKVAVLGCGFQMGAERYQSTVKEWTGLDINMETAEKAVDTYRSKKPGVKNFWYEIERTALRAVRKPGKPFFCGRDDSLTFVVRGQFLWSILPSGRPIAYALPRVEAKPTPWGEMKEAVTYCGINGYTRKWERMSTYGGHLTENVVQGTARDVMTEAMLRLDDAGYPLILSVHDELIADVPEDYGSLDEFLTLMRRVPSWAQGLNVEVEGYENGRYKK